MIQIPDELLWQRVSSPLHNFLKYFCVHGCHLALTCVARLPSCLALPSPARPALAPPHWPSALSVCVVPVLASLQRGPPTDALASLALSVCTIRFVRLCTLGTRSGLFEIWSKLAPRSQDNRTKGAAGEAKIGPWGYPPDVPKTGREKKVTPPGNNPANGSIMGTKI